MNILAASTLTMLIVAMPAPAANSGSNDVASKSAQSVEILRGDQVGVEQNDGEPEKEEKPARRGGCAWQCEKFRKRCEAYCKSQGHLPGMMSPTRTCREDCKQYKMACSRGCRGGSARR
jgi:hypothetical protein